MRVREFVESQVNKNDDIKTVGINEIAESLHLTKREVIAQLTHDLEDTLKENPDGLSITDLTLLMRINRNWIAKQLDLLLLAGKVEKRTIGPAKLYTYSKEGMSKWEKYYRALIENSSDIILVLAPDEKQQLLFNFVSNSCARIIGFSPNEMKGKLFKNFLHQDDSKIEDQFQSLFNEDNHQHTLNFRLLHKTEGHRMFDAVITDAQKDEDIQGYILNLRDITETFELEQKVQYRVVFDKLLLDLATKFIDLTPDKLDDALTRALQILGRFFSDNQLENVNSSVDRIYIYLLSKDTQTLIHTHNWDSPTIKTVSYSRIKSKDYLLPFLPLTQHPWLNALFEKNEIHFLPSISNLPESAEKQKRFFEDRNIESWIALPMVNADGNPLGFIGFDLSTSPIPWSDLAIDLLNNITPIFVSALQKLQREIKEDLPTYFASANKGKVSRS